MTQIFISSKDKVGDQIVVQDASMVHHLKDVLRLEKGKEVVAVDQAGRAYYAVIETCATHSITLKVVRECDRPLKTYSLAVACALPKKAKFDDIIDKLTQLGVDTIVPLVTNRVIVKIDAKSRCSKMGRWQKIAESASRQSQRNRIPGLMPPTDFKHLIAGAAQYDLKLIPALIGTRKPLRQVCQGVRAKNILACIGPEGDFTPEELELALSAGFLAVSLGPEVLRVDTAALAVASFIKCFYENS